MYQALYRKYRPSTFDEVYGQDIIKKTIINEINNNKISHAYLFCGPRGTGKTSIAKLIAKLVNCKKSINGKTCEQCESCVSFNNKNYIDIIEIDAASNNGVDEIRELRSKANLLPAVSKYKIYIIDEVHMLSIGAFNALLKTLEEPPKHVIFILATTEVNKIPITIVSRCQKFDFNRISENQIFERIKDISEKESIKITDEAIKEISTLTDGGLRDAIGLLDKLIAYTDEAITEETVHAINYSLTKKELSKLFEMIYMNDIENYITYICTINDRGIDLNKVVDELMIYLRDLLLNKIQNKFDKKQILNYINSLNELSNKMKLTNYPKILMETFIISVNGFKENVVDIPLIKHDKNKETNKKNNNNVESSELNTIETENNIKEQNENKIIENNEQEIINKQVSNIDNLDKLIDIRINNVFYSCDKAHLNELKSKWSNISEYAVNSIYGMAAGILLDSEVVVASENNIVVIYPYTSMSERANNDIPKIEELLKIVFNKEYKFISLDQNKWNFIKKEYIKNLKNNIKYEYIEEKVDYNILFNTKENEIVNQAMDIFGEDLIQVI